jgi:hypothetical protein
VNIDNVSANVVTAFSGSIGDASGNVYVGTNAGNSYSNTLGNTNVVALGVNAGTGSSNSTKSVFIGYNTGAGSLGSSNTIAIGTNKSASGSDNIYLGRDTYSASGSSNIFIGQGVAPTGINSNTLLIGTGGYNSIAGANVMNGIFMSATTTGIPVYLYDSNSNTTVLYSCNAVGINTTTPTYTLDVNGYARVGTNQNGGLGINTNPYDYSLNVNGDMRVSDGYGTLVFTHDNSNNSVTTLVPTGTYSGATATLQVSDGFFSATGVTGGSASTIPLKKGMFMVSAFRGATMQGYVGVAANSTSHTTISTNGGGLIVSNTSNLGVDSNTTWTITYFPSA